MNLPAARTNAGRRSPAGGGSARLAAATRARQALAGVALAAAGGCRAVPPAAVTDPPPPGPAGVREKAALSPAERAEARLALRSIAEGRRRRHPPAPAPAGVRWADIPLALHLAGEELGVELTVVETFEDERRYRFVLETVEDWPGELIIERRDAPAVYEVVECRIGRFPRRPARQERCRRLLEKLREHLEALGARPWFNENPP